MSTRKDYRSHIVWTKYVLTTIIPTVVLSATIGFLQLYLTDLSAQPAPSQTSPQSITQVTLSGTLHLYLVTNYGEKMQEVDRYRTTGEGSMIAFILKTDEKIDMTRYLSEEEIEALKDYAGTTLQSEFMVVPDWEVFESFSNEAFAAQFANKRVCVTGSFFYPDGGWQNVTPVRMDFSKVEVVE